MTTTTSSEKEIKKEVNEPQVENQPKKESFFKRHKKKIIGGLAVIGLAAGGVYLYTRSNKKAAPSQETAEGKEAAQINKEEQQPRGDRDDRRNNRHGGNRQNW